MPPWARVHVLPNRDAVYLRSDLAFTRPRRGGHHNAHATLTQPIKASYPSLDPFLATCDASVPPPSSCRPPVAPVRLMLWPKVYNKISQIYFSQTTPLVYKSCKAMLLAEQPRVVLITYTRHFVSQGKRLVIPAFVLPRTLPVQLVICVC